MDNVEALIDEWFPGLRDIDVVNGTQLVTPLSLCPFCNGEWRKRERERENQYLHVSCNKCNSYFLTIYFLIVSAHVKSLPDGLGIHVVHYLLQ